MIWFQLGMLWDAGPEITNGLGAFLHAVTSKHGFGRASFLRSSVAVLAMQANQPRRSSQ